MLTLKPGKAALTGKAVKRDEFNGKARSNKRSKERRRIIQYPETPIQKQDR